MIIQMLRGVEPMHILVEQEQVEQVLLGFSQEIQEE